MNTRFLLTALAGLAALTILPSGAQAHNASCGQTVEYFSFGNARLSVTSGTPCPVVVVPAPVQYRYVAPRPAPVYVYTPPRGPLGVYPAAYSYGRPYYYYKNDRHDPHYDGRHDDHNDHDRGKGRDRH
jgi:hypothetical protein